MACAGQLGEHSVWRKMTCFELGTRVPFILHVPWMKETAGSRTLQLTELIDGETHTAALLGPVRF